MFPEKVDKGLSCHSHLFKLTDIHFFEMDSPIKGWSGIVAMDWSNNFWDKMKKGYRNLEIV